MGKKALTLIALGLVAGLTLGALGVAGAAPAAEETTAPASGFGLRLGPVMREAGARLADIVARLTGLGVDEVFERRAEGESIAEIAESEGVDAGKVVDEALAARKAILDERVADGTLSAEDEAAILERMETRLDERVQSDAPRGGGGFGRGGGRGGAGHGAGGGCGGCYGAPAAPAP